LFLGLVLKDYKGYWSLTVSGNWRVIFQFEDADVILVDYLDTTKTEPASADKTG
jgi:plasmid maintenance system killer protein